MTKEKGKETQTVEEGALPSWLASFASSTISAPMPLSGTDVESRKSQVVDLMSEAAELDDESQTLGAQKGAVDKVLRDKQSDARRIAHEIHFKVRNEEVECVRVPLVGLGLVALRRPDKRGMPILALYDLGDAEAEATGQLKLSARSRKFIDETAEKVGNLTEVDRAMLQGAAG